MRASVPRETTIGTQDTPHLLPEHLTRQAAACIALSWMLCSCLAQACTPSWDGGQAIADEEIQTWQAEDPAWRSAWSVQRRHGEAVGQVLRHAEAQGHTQHDDLLLPLPCATPPVSWLGAMAVRACLTEQAGRSGPVG